MTTDRTETTDRPDDHACIARLADAWDGISTIGHGLDDDGWTRPTDCPGWTVRDQLSHIIGTESTLLGRPAPEPVPPGPHVRNPMGEFNEAWVEARRVLPGASVLSEFDEVTALRLAALRAMTPAEFDAPGPSPVGTVPYATFMDVRVMDCWIHEQDIRSALGLHWRFDGPAAPVALDRLAATFGYAVGKRVGPPEGTVVVLDVTGPADRTLAVEITGGRAVPADGGAWPTVHLTMGTQDWVRLVAGRITPADAAGRRAVTVEGDAELGDRVLANLTQMP